MHQGLIAQPRITAELCPLPALSAQDESDARLET